MKKIILTFIFALMGIIVNSQNCFWAKNAGGVDSDFGYGMTTDKNGNVYVTGSFAGNSIAFGTTTVLSTSTGYNFFIVKYSAGGQVLWAHGANSTAGAEGKAIATDTAGNVYVTGNFASQSITFGTQTLTGNAVSYADVFVVKYDTDGNALWVSGMGGDSYDYPEGIAVDDGGNVYVTGNFYSSSISFGNSVINNTGTDYTDYFIAKFNQDGNPVWAEGAGGTRYEYGKGITTCNGDVYVTGCFQSDSASFGGITLYNDEPGNYVLFLLDYDTTGSVIWAKEIDGLWGDVVGNSITHDIDGNLLVALDFRAYYLVFGSDTMFNHSSGSGDIMVIKYDPSGNELWINMAGGTHADNVSSVTTDSDGNVYITGGFSTKIIFDTDTILSGTSGSIGVIYVAKYNALGDYIWARKVGGNYGSISRSISAGPDDDLYFTGNYSNQAQFGTITLNAAGSYDIFVADVYNFNSSITSYSDATCNGTANGTAFTTASEGNLPYTYLWSTTPPETTPDVIDLPSGNFVVTITEAYGCSQTHSVSISEPPEEIAAICMVTVDSLSMYNIIYWDKTPYSRVDTFVVYREITTNNYQPIGSVPYAAPSQFVDTVRTLYFPNTGNPNAGTYRYKILLHDTCGKYGDLSLYHNTIYFLNNSGTFFLTQPYAIENGANPVANYILMRDDYSTGNWQAVSSVAGTQQVVSDPLFSVYQATASWRVKTQWSISCGLSKSENSEIFNTSLSNIFSNYITVGTNENSLNDLLNIYPNPVTDKLIVETPMQIRNLEILDIAGRCIYESNNVNIDCHSFSSGIYFIKVVTDKEIIIRKFIKE